MDEIKLNKELKERYKQYGLCKECKRLNTGLFYCWSCKSQYFKQNFKNWTSENHDVDEFIQKAQLKAKNLIKYRIESNILICGSSHGWVVRCFGITKDPKTNNFIMVMKLITGSLRQHLNNNFISHDWNQKLSNFDDYTYITDLGLCQPANIEHSQSNNKKIYGVLPYMAPEVLRGKEYTQKSDIYGFGIIAYEICTGFPPYHDIAHDEFLAMKICQGLRPKSNYKVPQLIVDIINQCWDADPLKRPNAEELHKTKNADNNDLEYSDSLKMDFTKPDINPEDESN
ncbi:unnamed protein product [Rhizophagus irregularis]|nr:unnamed protein product [Rhizophagus irregularis]